MTSCKCAINDDSHPQLAADTGHFRKGAPRSFVISPQGHRVGFVQADSGDSSTLNVWMLERLDQEPVLRKVLDAAQLLTDDETLSAAERARRERLRESGSGITAFSADETLSTIAFSLSGTLWIADTVSGNASAIEDYSAVVDPRLNPQGSLVAFTTGADFVVYDVVEAREILRKTAESDTVSYGLADFIAAEELERYRGHWWSPDGQRILVQRTDEAAVPVAWIADPTHPEVSARSHRYPAAGQTNASISMHHIDLQTSQEFQVDLTALDAEYIGHVEYRSALPHFTTLNRAQTIATTYEMSFNSVKVVSIAEDSAWVDAGTNLPYFTRAGNVFTENLASAGRTVLKNGEPLVASVGHIDGILFADDTRVVVAHYNEPWQLVISALHADGTVEHLSRPDGYAIGVVVGDYSVIVQHSLDAALPTFEVKRGSTTIASLPTHQKAPEVQLSITIGAITERQLPYAVILPENHVRGSHKLPVIVAIYGGPHHAEVIASRLSFADDQWLSNQGFAVVVIDNAGTPGKNPEWERAVKNDLTDIVLSDQVLGLQAILAAYPDDLDADRVGIHGWSFGGYLSALAVLDRPDVYHAAWSGAPVTDWALYDTGYTERYLGTPQENPQAYDNGSLILKAHKLQRPLTLIHGLADDNVLSAHSLQLSGALLAAGKSHSFLPLAGVSHMTPQREITVNLMLLMREFFQKNL